MIRFLSVLAAENWVTNGWPTSGTYMNFIVKGRGILFWTHFWLHFYASTFVNLYLLYLILFFKNEKHFKMTVKKITLIVPTLKNLKTAGTANK